MATKLGDIRTTGISVKTRKKKTKTKKKEKVKIPYLDTLKEVEDIEPFLEPDLLIDLIFILKDGAMREYMDSKYPEVEGVSLEPVDLDKSLENEKIRNEFMTNYEYSDKYKKYGIRALRKLVEISDPDDPSSIIFNYSQDEHKATQKVAIDLIRGIEVAEREDVQCKCGSRRIRVTSKQTRGMDEAATLFYNCTVCGVQWRGSAA